MKLPRLPENKFTRRAILAIAGCVLFLILLLALITPSTETQPPPPPKKVVEKAPPAPISQDNSQIILELFNPSDASLQRQLTSTSINEQMEQSMTLSYMLSKCRIISEDDYTNHFRALILYAQRTKLAADPVEAEKLVRQIADAAATSYTLIYSRITCDDARLKQLGNDQVRWSNDILSHY